MIAQAGGVFERGRNVAILEDGIIRKNLLAAGTGRQEVKNVLNADAQPSDAWPASGLIRVD